MSEAMTPRSNAAQVYVRYWAVALKQLLEWDRDRVNSWMTQYENELSNDCSMLYREYPAHYITPLLVPSSIKGKLEAYDQMVLRSRLEGAIAVHDFSEESLKEYNWDAALDRVTGILAEFGESLENVRREVDDI